MERTKCHRRWVEEGGRAISPRKTEQVEIWRICRHELGEGGCSELKGHTCGGLELEGGCVSGNGESQWTSTHKEGLDTQMGPESHRTLEATLKIWGIIPRAMGSH